MKFLPIILFLFLIQKTTLVGTVAAPSAAFRNSRVLLNEGEYVAFIQASGRFSFPNLPPKHYVLDVVCPGYVFPRYKVDISSRGDIAVYRKIGLSNQQVDLPLTIDMLSEAQYELQPKSLSILSMLKSPMVLVSIFTAVMVVIFSAAMKHVDPNELKQVQDQMGLNNDPNKMLGKLFGMDDSKEEEIRRRVTKKAISNGRK